MTPEKRRRTIALRTASAVLALGLMGSSSYCFASFGSSGDRTDDPPPPPPPPGPEDDDAGLGWFRLARSIDVRGAAVPVEHVTLVEGPTPRAIDVDDPDPAELAWLVRTAIGAHPEIFGQVPADAPLSLCGVRSAEDAVTALFLTESGSVWLGVGERAPRDD